MDSRDGFQCDVNRVFRGTLFANLEDDSSVQLGRQRPRYRGMHRTLMTEAC
jgi:hypothetical protein